MATYRVEENKLRGFAEKVLQKAGVSEVDSQIIIDIFICADNRGIHTHGVGKLSSYIERIDAGVLNPVSQIEIERETSVTATINANNSFGQVAAYRAMEMAIAKAKTSGISMLLVNHSNHFGIASYYALMAAKYNMIGVVQSNSSPGIAPFGAKEKLFGTNPIAVAVPSLTHFPLVLDMSSSVVARGKVRQALAAGEDIPLGWARDQNGNPTTDPADALKGTLEAIAGPKGSGIALMVEIFCGILSGAGLPGEVRVITDTTGPCNTGHLLCAIDPGCFTDKNRFFSDVDKTIERIKNLSPINNEIYLPGEIEHNYEEDARKHGIELKESAMESLKALSEKFKVEF
jgi:LDH2 family malate/lactate/ureidoglycolate dehydrogenase